MWFRLTRRPAAAFRSWALIFALLAGVSAVVAAAPFCGPAAAQDDPTLTKDAADAATDKDLQVPYDVSLEGLEDEAVRQALISVSNTYNLRESPPPSVAMLVRRVERDLPQMEKALDAEGYFQGVVKAHVGYDPKDKSAFEALEEIVIRVVELDLGQVPRPHVVFTVEPGPPFLLDVIELVPSSTEHLEGLTWPDPADLGLVKGERFQAKLILEAQRKVLRELGRQGRPFPQVTDRRLTANHADHTVKAVFYVRPGPPAVFGHVQVQGTVDVKESYVLNQVAWKEGARFDQDLLDRTRSRLLSTGLFSVVDIERGDIGEDQRLEMLVTVKERAHRTFKAGVNYQTDKGPGAQLGWEHRNYFGRGEKLALDLEGNELEKYATTSFRKPGFFRRDQALILRSRLAYETTDAYESRSIDNLGEVERQLSRIMTAALGVRYRVSDVEENEEVFGIFSLPARFSLDNSDDLFDPSRGGRLDLEGAPAIDTLNQQRDLYFYRFVATYSHYFSLMAERKLILALRGSYGLVEGADREELPRDELLYAGGGGSVRGFAYQFAGEMEDGDPAGGLSRFEGSVEFRYRFTNTVGMVAFLDAGRAYEDPHPDFADEPFYGSGLGFRYYSGIGPIRLDLAFPLNRREGTDDRYQVYVSLGQAF